jgi:hypothetical protein
MRFSIKPASLFGIAIGLLAVGLVVYSIVRYWETSLEDGYIKFNAGQYAQASSSLSLIAKVGDNQAQQLMAYMAGLGLGREVNFGESISWMNRINREFEGKKSTFHEQAFYIGKAANDGLYGEEKKQLGRLWLSIAEKSGSEKAKKLLEIQK